MAENSLERFKKHISKPVEVILKSQEGEEDTFLLKPVNYSSV